MKFHAFICYSWLKLQCAITHSRNLSGLDTLNGRVYSMLGWGGYGFATMFTVVRDLSDLSHHSLLSRDSMKITQRQE